MNLRKKALRELDQVKEVERGDMAQEGDEVVGGDVAQVEVEEDKVEVEVVEDGVVAGGSMVDIHVGEEVEGWAWRLAPLLLLLLVTVIMLGLHRTIAFHYYTKIAMQI